MSEQLEMMLEQDDKQPALSKVANHALGMFYQPTDVHEFSVGPVEFLIGHAEGFNAGGLIGTEFNGVFLVCLTDRRVVFREHMKQASCYVRHEGHRRAVKLEIDRVLRMNADALEDFISTRASYNPFADRRRRKKALKGDLNIRRRFSALTFKDGRWISAKDKRTIVHDWEKLIVARIFGGRAFARSRFTGKLYKLLSGPYGHIAHYNVEGFYDAQLMEQRDFDRNLRMVANHEGSYGLKFGPSTQHMIDQDLEEAMAMIAGAYVGKHYID